MKFLTFVDVHADRKYVNKLVARAKKKDVDFIICAGDFTQFGRGLHSILNKFKSCKKTMYLVPGNHESDRMFKEQLTKHPFCVNLHKQALTVGDYIFVGFGEGGFVQQEPEFRKIARQWYNDYNGKKIVFITHGPPYGTKLDLLEKKHVGNHDYRKFIERIKPKVAISGHLHETANQVDTIGKTKVINPGWEGMVVELS